MLASLEGLDHVVVMARDLALAADNWRALGFTVSPRGTHSAHVGTGNHTIMFDTDYVELMGILTDTDLNAPGRDFLRRRGDGLERAAFTTSDAAAGAAALRSRGLEALGPVEFSRPVSLPGGAQAKAAFSVFHWPNTERPADIRLFACQHHTRDAVWIAALQSHPNTATGIARLVLVTPVPQEDAARLASLIDSQALPDGAAARVPTGHGRAEFVFMSQTEFLARHPGARQEELPQTGAAALVLRVNDLEAAARAAGTAAARDATSVTVAARRANGVILVFEQAAQAAAGIRPGPGDRSPSSRPA